MRKIEEIKVLENYILFCRFSNGDEKFVDIKPFLNSEAFLPLKNYSIFSNIKNHTFFISWLDENVYLSADTLWNIGEKENLSFANS